MDWATFLFGLPFVGVGVFLLIIAVMMIAGQTLIYQNEEECLLFIGVSPIGLYRRFNWKDIQEVDEDRRSSYNPIVLKGAALNIKLGWGMKLAKKQHVITLLKEKLDAP